MDSNILKKLDFFSLLDSEAIFELRSILHHAEIKKGDFFLKEGQVCNKIGFMDKGFMKQFYNIDGEEVIKWVFIEKDIVCSFGSFVKNMPSNENIQAIKNSHIYYINKTDFQKLYTKHDSIKNLWISQIQSFLIGLEERIYIMISKQAKARYEFFLTHYPVHARQIPLQYLASLLGIAPQHLSRIRKS